MSLQQLALQMQTLEKQEQQYHVGGSTSAYSHFGSDFNKNFGLTTANELFSPQVCDSKEFIEEGLFDSFSQNIKEPSSMLGFREMASIFSDTNTMSAVSSGMVDNVYSGYANLTEAEKAFVKNHPFLAMDFMKNANEASEKTKGLEGIHNGIGDAIRHCYWSALNQMDAGLDSRYAEEFGTAHESSPDNDVREKEMDLYNNRVGYNLGNRAIRENWSKEKLYQEIEQCALSGALKTLK